MTVPTLDKTYQVIANVATGGTGVSATDHASFWFNLKNALVTFPTNPWVVKGSCSKPADAVKAIGEASPDLWASAADVRRGAVGALHSWIVLERTGIAGGHFQFCIDYAGTQDWLVYLAYSPSGAYTGGTKTARPTAADEVILNNGVAWCGSGLLTASKMHTMQSTDGEVTRMCMMTAGATLIYFSWEKPKNPISGWTDPWFMTWCHATAECVTYAVLYAASANTWAAPNSLAASPIYYTSESWANQGGGQRLTTAADLTTEWPLFPVGLACEVVGARGYIGDVFDLWWGSTTPIPGDSYPLDASRAFVHFGDLVVPWDGSVIEVS